MQASLGSMSHATVVVFTVPSVSPRHSLMLPVQVFDCPGNKPTCLMGNPGPLLGRALWLGVGAQAATLIKSWGMSV